MRRIPIVHASSEKSSARNRTPPRPRKRTTGIPLEQPTSANETVRLSWLGRVMRWLRRGDWRRRLGSRSRAGRWEGEVVDEREEDAIDVRLVDGVVRVRSERLDRLAAWATVELVDWTIEELSTCWGAGNVDWFRGGEKADGRGWVRSREASLLILLLIMSLIERMIGRGEDAEEAGSRRNGGREGKEGRVSDVNRRKGIEGGGRGTVDEEDAREERSEDEKLERREAEWGGGPREEASSQGSSSWFGIRLIILSMLELEIETGRESMTGSEDVYDKGGSCSEADWMRGRRWDEARGRGRELGWRDEDRLG
jgi:hypothetical protein